MKSGRTIAVLWRRLDRPGHETARLQRAGTGWELDGAAVFFHRKEPCSLTYRIGCDSNWRTRSVEVAGWLGRKTIRVEAKVGRAGVWKVGGDEVSRI